MPANANDTRTPDEIEQDIRDTQQQMNRTARQIGEELTPRNLVNALLDQAEERGVDARFLLDATRRNPLALGMIAIGGLWLVSDADARPSALKPSGMKGLNFGRSGDTTGSDHWHPEHRAYVDHMSLHERKADEDDLTYLRRRDTARANYFMIERGHDEDEHSFRQRLDHATEGLRQRRDKASETMHSRMDHMRDSSRQAAGQAQSLYEENPLIGGLAAALVGAMVGAAVPASRMEEDTLGTLGEQAIDAARDKAKHVGEQARSQKDAMVDKADNRLAGDKSQRQAGQAETPVGTGQTI